MAGSTPADAANREVDCLVTIGRAAGKVAHQVNNPLGSIHNAFLLVKDAIPLSHPYFRYVATIEENIARIAAVTQRFVDTYQPERDRACGVPVSAIVSGAVQSATAMRKVAPARVVLDNGVHDPYPGPAGLLRHAVGPLLDAAFAMLPDDEPLHIAVTVHHDLLRIAIDAQRSAPDPSVDVRDAERRIAVMGGTLGGVGFATESEMFVLTIPMTSPLADPE